MQNNMRVCFIFGFAFSRGIQSQHMLYKETAERLKLFFLFFHLPSSFHASHILPQTIWALAGYSSACCHSLLMPDNITQPLKTCVLCANIRGKYYREAERSLAKLTRQSCSLKYFSIDAEQNPLKTECCLMKLLSCMLGTVGSSGLGVWPTAGTKNQVF